jgi:hypothetical protein
MTLAQLQSKLRELQFINVREQDPTAYANRIGEIAQVRRRIEAAGGTPQGFPQQVEGFDKPLGLRPSDVEREIDSARNLMVNGQTEQERDKGGLRLFSLTNGAEGYRKVARTTTTTPPPRQQEAPQPPPPAVNGAATPPTVEGPRVKAKLDDGFEVYETDILKHDRGETRIWRDDIVVWRGNTADVPASLKIGLPTEKPVDPYIALLGRFADTQDAMREIQASQVQLEQAWRDSQVQLQAAGEERLTAAALKEPGANLFSTYGQFRRAGEAIPLTPDLAALVQGMEIPGSGNIPGTGIQTIPNTTNIQQLFRDALSRASSRTIQNLEQPSFAGTKARLLSFGAIGGVDPLAEYERRRAALPQAGKVTGSIFSV